MARGSSSARARWSCRQRRSPGSSASSRSSVATSGPRPRRSRRRFSMIDRRVPRSRAAVRSPLRLGGARASRALRSCRGSSWAGRSIRGRQHRSAGVEVLRSARVRVVVRAREARDALDASPVLEPGRALSPDARAGASLLRARARDDASAVASPRRSFRTALARDPRADSATGGDRGSPFISGEQVCTRRRTSIGPWSGCAKPSSCWRPRGTSGR